MPPLALFFSKAIKNAFEKTHRCSRVYSRNNSCNRTKCHKIYARCCAKIPVFIGFFVLLLLVLSLRIFSASAKNTVKTWTCIGFGSGYTWPLVLGGFMDDEVRKERLRALDSLAAIDESLGLFERQTAIPQELTINGYTLKMTCMACPEQYDVFNAKNVQVGYLRLRHGWFRADCPDVGGDVVYEAYTRGDGCFDDDERLPQLTAAVNSIDVYWKKMMENVTE